jgi:MFS family permease
MRLPKIFSTFRGLERDARVYLLTSFVFGCSLALFWINFNLYLAALGLDRPQIGLISTAGSIAGILVSFPASIAADRFGRRASMVLSAVLVNLALVGLLFGSEPWHFFLLSGLYGAGIQAFFVVEGPFLTEHSREDNRSELFALQYATVTATNIVAAVIGSAIAAWLTTAAHFVPDGPEVHRVLIVVQLALMLVGLATVFLLSNDRRKTAAGTAVGAAPPPASRGFALLRRYGVVIDDPPRFARLVLPSFIITIGAGQLIPFLNLFVQRKFGLDLAAVNGVFAFMSIGTVVAILVQPLLARRFGKVGSVVLVQALSIPFLAILGFSPVLVTVILAMAVRNSLMNAGNPIFSAFAMEQVSPAGRATLSAMLSVLFSVGWALGGPWYSLLQARLGFDTGYAVNFVTIIVLYSVATILFWRWFRDAEPRPSAAAQHSPAGDGRATTWPEP